MKRKLLAAVLIFAMLFSLVPSMALAGTTADGFEYTVSGDTVTIIKYTGTDTTVDIPATFDRKHVTAIASRAFDGCSSLTSITIPDSVTSIGEYAFNGCSGLSTVTFESTSNLTSIGERAFSDCSSLTSITIPNSVTSIGAFAFNGCSRLSTVTFESTSKLTSIGMLAFNGCSGLTSINIPNSVTSIGESAFNGCSRLSTVTFESTSNLTSIGKDVFNECSSLTSINIPNSVTSIGEFAFNRCSRLSTVTFESTSNLTSIGERAFNECSSLISITIPNSVTSIEMFAFNGCSGLTSITIPNSVTSIEMFAFNGCSSLTNVTITGSGIVKQTILGKLPGGASTWVDSSTDEAVTTATQINDGSITLKKCEHKNNTNPLSCDSAVKCSVCNTQLAAIGHDFTGSIVWISTDADGHYRQCSRCTVGDTANKTAHSYDNACDTDCNVCGYVRTITHDYTDLQKNETEHWYICSVCGVEKPQSHESHKGGSASCTAQAKCDVCGAAYGSKEDHDYGNDNTCDVCGYERVSGGDGGFSGDYNYPVVVAESDDAKVTLSEEHAIAGETVTITVTPSSGKQVDEVIVTDEDGEVIAVTKTGDNTYTFTMPKGKVNVAVTTKAIDYDTKVVLQIGNKNVVVDGKPFANDVAPLLQGDRTLVPIRVIIEALGGEVDWNEATRTVTITIDGKVLTLVIDQPIPGFGQGAAIMDNRTYVPIRYVAEYVGAHVEWIAESQQIVILK